MKRFVLMLLATALVMGTVPVVASASVPSDTWYQQYKLDYEHVGPIIDGQDDLFDPQLIACADANCNPAPEGTDLDTAIREGYSTYYDEGVMYSVSDAQEAVANATHEVIQREYMIDGDYKSSETINNERYYNEERPSVTSSSVSNGAKHWSGKYEKEPGKVKSNLIEWSRHGDTEQVAEVLDGDTKHKAAGTIGKHLSKTFGVLTTLADGKEAYDVSLGLTNLGLQIFHVDQSMECKTFKDNGVVKKLLLLDEACEQYEDTTLPIGSTTNVADFDGRHYIPQLFMSPDGGGFSRLPKVKLFFKSATLFDVSFKVENGLDQDIGLKYVEAPVDDQFPVEYAPSYEDYIKINDQPYRVPSLTVPKHSTKEFHWTYSRTFWETNSDCKQSGYVNQCLSHFYPSHDWIYMYPDTCDDYTKCTVDKSYKPTVHDEQASVQPTVTVIGDDGKTYTAVGDPVPQDGSLTFPPVKLPDGVQPKSIEAGKKAGDGSAQVIIPKQDLNIDTHFGGRLDLIDMATQKSCFLEGYACADWATQVKAKTVADVTLDNKATTTTNPDLGYKCVYDKGGKLEELPIGECTILKPQFKPDHQTTGTTGADPDNGDTLPDPSADPRSKTSIDVGSCVKTQVSMNPVSWVTVPVKCALSWAFEPDQTEVTTRRVAVQRQVKNGMVGELQTSYEKIVPDDQGSNCEGPEMTWAPFGLHLVDHAHPLSVCPGTGFEILPTFFRAGFTVMFAVFGLMGVRRLISSLIGLNDSGGGDSE